MQLVLYGNHEVDYCSEVQYVKTLKSLGHDVISLQENRETADKALDTALKSDGFIWIHSHGFKNHGMDMQNVLSILKNSGIPTIAYHLDLYLGLDRWEDYKNSPYMKVEHFFTVDKLMADWFNENTEVNGHYLPAGVFEPECVMLDKQPVDYEVIFVGSKNYHPEWPYRTQLINWLRETYGRKFLHVGGDGDTGTVRGLELNQIYANAKVSVGDSLCINFDYPYYWSDRVYETLGRGGFMIHPEIEGMRDTFEGGEHLLYYDFGNFEQLKSGIDFALNYPWAREKMRKQGHEHVKKNHTYTNRWQTILETVYGKE